MFQYSKSGRTKKNWDQNKCALGTNQILTDPSSVTSDTPKSLP